MKRHLLSGLYLILAIFYLPQGAFALADLKASAIVSKSTITLGDLFDNLDHGHDIWVMNAPAPGKRASISTRYLANLTRQHNVYWQNSRGLQHISVLRKGKSLKAEDLTPLIEQELSAVNPENSKLGVTLESQNATLYLLENGTLEDIRIEKFTYSARTNSFTAKISIPLEDNNASTEIIRGRTFAKSYIPTLNKTLSPGQTIKGSDISWVALPTLNIGRNIIRDKDQLIGMTPRRGLNAATPVKLSDLQRPQIITRGQPVTIMFQSGKITLTAIGKAIENGGQGDMVRVMNVKSNKTIEAIVTGPNLVQVLTAQTSIAQLNESR